MSVATVGAIVGIAGTAYSIYNQSKGGGANTAGGPPMYVPTGLGAADTQWQQLMQQLFGNVTSTAGMLGPDMTNAYKTLMGIPTDEIRRTGDEAGKYYQNLASQADQFHNIMSGHATDNLQVEKDLQGQGTDFMKQMLALGMPLFGQGQDYQKQMQALGMPLFQQGQDYQKQFGPMAQEMMGAGRDYYQRQMGNMGDVIGAGKAFQQSQLGPASELRGAGRQLWETALDPQQKLANYLGQKVTEGSRAATSARGIGMSGNAAGLENEATDKFLMDWQDRQLGRQQAGLQGMTGAFGQGGQLENAGINALLNSYGIGNQMGGSGINAMFGGMTGAGNLLSQGLQGMLGEYGMGSGMLNQGLLGMLGEYGMGTNMLNSGAQNQQNYFNLANQYGKSGMQDLNNSMAMGSLAPGFLQQSSMVPYMAQAFGPQMAMQYANMLGQGMNQNVYNPLAGAMGQIIPYMNYGQGATNSAFDANQANMANLIKGIGSFGQSSGGKALGNWLDSWLNPTTPGGGSGGYQYSDYGGSPGYGGDYYGGGGMGSP